VRIHREGYPTLIIAGISLAIFSALGQSLLNDKNILWFTIPLSIIIWGFIARFFRNPSRTTPYSNDHIIAPADGKIVDIQRVQESEYFCDERVKVSIYMSVLNVHLNRTPLTGEVRYVKYHPGNYLVAFHPKASELNERSTIVIADSRANEVLVRQIAGFLARRIVTYLQPEQAVRAGEELGFIKFGSRCDVFLPVDANVLVALNQHVRGGETPIAQL
jgi:phosphatidylserine decarboxylase